MKRLGDEFQFHHITEHLWLAEAPTGAWFETQDDQGRVVDLDVTFFPSRAEACRAYREGYVPNVTYP